MKITAEEHCIGTNGIRLHTIAAGPADGPLVILLHGFPEFWYGWRHQIPALAAAGYRVLAPDQRGYNLSEKPRGVGAYRLALLAADVIGLIDAAGRDQAVLIGHDWGAAVAWAVALVAPARVARLVVCNVPHPAVMLRTLLTNPRQLLRSSYIFFFQLPGLPEWVSRAGHWRSPVSAMRHSSRAGTFTAADFQRYRRAWARPGAFTSMIHWYRAAVRRPGLLFHDPRVQVPTLIVWGAQDRFLIREMATASLRYCAAGRLALLKDVSHWVPSEAPRRFNQLILDFLAG